MKTGFIIVSYHLKPERLSEILVSLNDYPTAIVDNGGSSKVVHSTKVQIIENPSNMGFGGAANRGIEELLEDNFEWLVILNQDLLLLTSAVKTFVRALENEPGSIVGPLAGSLDKKRWTTILPSRYADYISGSCIAIHRSVFEKIGYFYEPYFMYYEDADLCVRAKRAGFALTDIPIFGIGHTETTSLGAGSYLHQYYLARNHLLFVERNAPAGVKLYEFLRLPKTLWEHVTKKEWGALTGIRDYFFRRFGQYRE